MNPVRAAVWSALNGDTTLKALLSGPNAIHHRVAPQGATFPVVVLTRMAGTPEWQFDGAHIQTDVWLIKGITKGSDPGAMGGRAEDIAARIDTVLTDAVFAVTGCVLLGIYRELDVDYEEVTAGEIYHHVGAQFRVITQPN